MSNSSWVPNEPASVLFAERVWLQGTVVSAFFFGITIPLLFMSYSLLLRGKNRIEPRKRISLLVYTTVIFLMGALYMCDSDAYTQLAFIDNRAIPGGPAVFEITQFWIPANVPSNIALPLVTWLCNGFLVWRFKVIYQSCGVPIWIVMLFPLLLFAASVALGVGFMVELSSQEGFRLTHGVDLVFPFYAVSSSWNVIFTIAIVLRLLFFKQRLDTVLRSKYVSQYTSALAIIIESALICSVISFITLVLQGIKHTIANVFVSFLPLVQLLAAIWIVCHIAQGKAWTEDTALYLTTGGMTDSSELMSAGEAKTSV